MAANDTFQYSLDRDVVYVSIRSIQKFLIPVVCFLGSTGNILAACTFLARTLRDKSCCLYLAAKCLSDTMFLISLFLVWLDRVDVPAFHLHGFCQIIIFVTYICGFLSVWFVVFITAENYIRVSCPGRVSQLCTPEKAKTAILILVIISIFVYHFPLWTTGIVLNNGTAGQCSLLAKYNVVNQGLTYADTVLTLALPSVLIIFLVVAILCHLYEAFKRQIRLRRLGRHPRRSFLNKSPHGRITKMLFAVSTVFILFHTPSHAIRLRLLILQFLNKDINPVEEFKLQRIFELLYYVNFSTNCVIYLIFGKSFRQVFKQIYCKPQPCCAKQKTSPQQRRFSSLFQSENLAEKETETICLHSVDDVWEKRNSATSTSDK
ncbi:FMRFamide receptor-like [Patella vulgata]|uniref:FMRFamide receptor-like n=1 Tax=Patella vulgata TaxID=6465 RepID=UPI0021807C01|nr:FMRFamide receptor-like [Patella vulgata]